MNYFLSGGCKNGKSLWAQHIAVSLPAPHFYLATMEPHDEEDLARIARHLRERENWGFETVECFTGILSALDGRNGTFLLDSVTALLSNEMFRADGTMDENAPERVADELAEFARRAENVVFVSDYLYADGIRYDMWSEAFRQGLALIDRRLAAVCENAAEFCYTCPVWYRGGWDGPMHGASRSKEGENGMELIIGGQYQGKTDWAKAEFSLSDGDFAVCEGTELPKSSRAVCHLERYTRACVEAGLDPCAVTDFAALEGKILICDEIASGLVPMDPIDRKWRDATGHFLARLAARANRVTRIFCGLPLRLR